MFTIRRYLLVCLLIVSTGWELYAQKHYYTVHRGSKEIGKITASLTQSLHTQTYEILSDVTFKILWKRYHRITSNLVIYESETMKTSYLGIYMNNELDDSTALYSDFNSYRCFRYPNDRFILHDTQLRFTTAKLYFQEPVGIQKVYSERFLQYCPLELQGNHKYKLSLPNGKTNFYTYEDNELKEIFVDRTWFNLEFRKGE